MPVQLTDNRKTERVILPGYSTPEEEIGVEVYTELLTGDLLEMPDGGNRYTQGVYMLKRMIKSWDFIDENGKQAPIDEAHLNLIKSKDLEVLLLKINALMDAQEQDELSTEKKSTLSDTLPQNSDLAEDK